MTRIFELPELLIASGNRGKFVELQELLSPFKVKLTLAADLAIVEPEETGDSFAANAVLKAKYYGSKTGLATLADDSGLAIELLNGEPGIYSARLAGESKDFTKASEELRLSMIEVSSVTSDYNSQASFICALALWWPDDHVEIFQGEVRGNITFPGRGSNGFGYDPIFIPCGCKLTFAEMSIAEKMKYSHRKRAFEQLVDGCFRI